MEKLSHCKDGTAVTSLETSQSCIAGLSSINSSSPSSFKKENDLKCVQTKSAVDGPSAKLIFLQSPSLRNKHQPTEVEGFLIYQPGFNGTMSSYKLAFDVDCTMANGDVLSKHKLLTSMVTEQEKSITHDLSSCGVSGHRKITGTGIEYICDMEDGNCKRSFASLPHLKNHQHIHYKNKELKCTFPQCGRKFTWAHHLRYHLKSHKGEKEFKCEVEGCSSSFYTAQQCNVHIRTHTGDKPFLCDICEKKFLTLQNLQNHKRTHTGEKPFACDYDGCRKSFAEKSSLKKHIVTHTGEKPYKCSHCKKGFTQSSTLHCHIRRYHMENPPPTRSIANIQAQQRAAKEAQEKQLQEAQKHSEPLVDSVPSHTMVQTETIAENETVVEEGNSSVPYDRIKEKTLQQYDTLPTALQYTGLRDTKQSNLGISPSSPDLNRSSTSSPFIDVDSDVGDIQDSLKLESSNTNVIVLAQPREINVVTTCEDEEISSFSSNRITYRDDMSQETDEEYTVYF